MKRQGLRAELLGGVSHEAVRAARRADAVLAAAREAVRKEREAAPMAPGAPAPSADPLADDAA